MSSRPKYLPKTSRQYKEAVKTLRKYYRNFGPDRIDLRRKLTSQQKSKISRYINDLRQLTRGSIRPIPIYRYKPEKQRRIQESVHQGQYFSRQLKVAFVPVSKPTAKPDIRVTKKGEVEVEEKGVIRHFAPISKEKLIIDPQNAVQDVLNEYPEVKRWFIAAGEHEIHRLPEWRNLPPDAEQIATALEQIMSIYSSERYDPTNPSSKYFGNWLGGLIGYEFKQTKSFQQYQASKRKSRQLRERIREEGKRKTKAWRLMNELYQQGIPLSRIEQELKKRGYLD